MDEQRQRADKFRPRLVAIAKQADALDVNWRRYIDGCYRKFTTTAGAGTSYGQAAGSSYGAAAGRDWFAVYAANSAVAWREDWSGIQQTDNATTAPCRMLWSDIESGSEEIRYALRSMSDESRADRIIPGIMRTLLAEYRLVSDEW